MTRVIIFFTEASEWVLLDGINTMKALLDSNFYNNIVMIVKFKNSTIRYSKSKKESKKKEAKKRSQKV